MKRQFVVLVLALGAACAASAQEATTEPPAADRNVAAVSLAAPAASATSFQPANAIAFSQATSIFAAPVSASPLGNAAPAATPAPVPDPKFVYGGRDDFRWQLAIGADWLRFRSSIFNASAVGIHSSVTYFTNEWFGIEGSVSTAFAPEIYQKEHVKLLVYGGGPKIAWRERRWEPWVHAIVGGAHEMPKTAGNSKNAFAVEVGGGADYRFNPRLSGRLQGDWVHTSFFSQSQNNFQLVGGVVFHF
jgi:opacity protein-like surface antigen